MSLRLRWRGENFAYFAAWIISTLRNTCYTSLQIQCKINIHVPRFKHPKIDPTTFTTCPLWSPGEISHFTIRAQYISALCVHIHHYRLAKWIETPLLRGAVTFLLRSGKVVCRSSKSVYDSDGFVRCVTRQCAVQICNGGKCNFSLFVIRNCRASCDRYDGWRFWGVSDRMCGFFEWKLFETGECCVGLYFEESFEMK